MEKEKTLSVTLPFNIRFSEVDSMGVVWHGHYAKYFEDAREAFGAKYGLEYLMMYGKGFFEPIVELTFKYKRVLIYGMKPEITITYCPCEAAKIIFDYEIRDTVTGEVAVTGHSVQVFMDANTHQLVLTSPDFYEEWKRKWEVNL
jgi:acyl-CoA thioester hydrolase